MINGDKALMVWTSETGISEVALCEVRCPTNWKHPIGKVVEMMKEVGFKNCQTHNAESEFLGHAGMTPLGKQPYHFWLVPITDKRATHNRELMRNWNCVSVIGYLYCERIILVELLDTIENQYHNAQSPQIFKSTGGSHEDFDLFASLKPYSEVTGVDTVDIGGVGGNRYDEKC